MCHSAFLQGLDEVGTALCFSCVVTCLIKKEPRVVHFEQICCIYFVFISAGHRGAREAEFLPSTISIGTDSVRFAGLQDAVQQGEQLAHYGFVIALVREAGFEAQFMLLHETRNLRHCVAEVAFPLGCAVSHDVIRI